MQRRYTDEQALEAWEESGHSLPKAAQLLGIDLSGLAKRLKKLLGEKYSPKRNYSLEAAHAVLETNPEVRQANAAKARSTYIENTPEEKRKANLKKAQTKGRSSRWSNTTAEERKATAQALNAARWGNKKPPEE